MAGTAVSRPAASAASKDASRRGTLRPGAAARGDARAARQRGADTRGAGDLDPVSVAADSFATGSIPTDTIGALHLGDDLIGEARQPRNPISRAQIETVLSRSVGGISLVFALQSLPAMLDQVDSRKADWALGMSIVLGLAIAFVVVATVMKAGVRLATGSVAIVYLVELIAWPFLMLDPGAVLAGKPWLWYLCTVATSCAAIAFPVFWASVYTFAAPVIYGIVRMLPSGGQADLLLASLDVVYAVLLGQAVVIIIYMLRQATAAVDVAQANALRKYAIAVRQHATDVERVEVDSIVHDSVLATLLSAAGVRSAKGAELAATMARNAIARLDEAGAEHLGDEAQIPLARLAERIRLAADAFPGAFTVVEHDSALLTVPEHVSEALYSATVQAMVNSMQHAGPADAVVSRTLTMGGNANGGCTIEIADTGVGFDLDAVPSGRLGLRISIQDRVTSAGGVVGVRTSIGKGAAIEIQWPRPDEKADPSTATVSGERPAGERPAEAHPTAEPSAEGFSAGEIPDVGATPGADGLRGRG